METIVVDSSSGDVGVSSMIKCANPNVNSGSILRSVNGVLNDAPCGTTKKCSINQRSTVVADLSTCNYILDNLPGRRWDTWRRESAEEFKRSLAEHVERARAGQDQRDEPENKDETKSSALEKSLMNVGITGSIRVDEPSGKGSVIDVIKLLCPGIGSAYAGQILTRVAERDRRVASIATRVTHIQINGKGRTTPVTDVNTLIEILWMLLGKTSNTFHRKAAETICRVMGGDLELCHEIERNNNFWKSVDGGEIMQRALIEPVEYKEEVSHRVYECSVRDALAAVVGGVTEVRTPSGMIDVLSDTEVIEVKYYRQWKHGFGQVFMYGSHYPLLAKRLHLFAYAPDASAEELVDHAKSMCGLHAVEVTFELISVPEQVQLDDS